MRPFCSTILPASVTKAWRITRPTFLRREFAAKATKELGIPAILPLEDGVEALVPIFKQMIDESIAQV
jgi:hypothetical protein